MSDNRLPRNKIHCFNSVRAEYMRGISKLYLDVFFSCHQSSSDMHSLTQTEKQL